MLLIWYRYVVFTWFTSFAGYADDLFRVIFNFQIKDHSWADNLTNLEDNLKKLDPAGFVGFAFFNSDFESVQLKS